MFRLIVRTNGRLQNQFVRDCICATTRKRRQAAGDKGEGGKRQAATAGENRRQCPQRLSAPVVHRAPRARRPLEHFYADMKRLYLAALAVAGNFFAAPIQAQSSDAGPLDTPTGQVQFVRDGQGFSALLANDVFDRFSAHALTHFDDMNSANGTVARVLVQTDSGPVLYDFRRRPPLVQRIGARMSVKRVFWQGDEVVMQGSQGWFRFQRGVLTKLQSSKTIYH